MGSAVSTGLLFYIKRQGRQCQTQVKNTEPCENWVMSQPNNSDESSEGLNMASLTFYQRIFYFYTALIDLVVALISTTF